jgi:maltose O-acetyltransferase
MRHIIRFFLFYFYDTYYVVGSSGKLKIGKNCGLANTFFNLSSGSIIIGNNTIFSSNVMVLTGRHNFKNGMRASLNPGVIKKNIGGGAEEVPTSGYDIIIGNGSWIAAGTIITGGVKIGDNVIIGANSLVTKDIPNNCFAAGIPAKIISFHKLNYYD